MSNEQGIDEIIRAKSSLSKHASHIRVDAKSSWSGNYLWMRHGVVYLMRYGLAAKVLAHFLGGRMQETRIRVKSVV